MTTIPQLPQAARVSPTDQIMLDQSGTSSAVTIDTLQAGLQPLLTLAQGALLGRVSLAPGQPEPVSVGAGLQLVEGAVAVDTTQIAPLASPVFSGVPTAPTPSLGDSSNRVATTAFVQARYYQPVTLTGDVVGTGSTTVPVTLPAITTPGVFTKVAVNAKGQVTGGTTTLTPTDMSGLASVAMSGSYTDLTNKPAAYVLPAASAAALGGVKSGANVTIAADGTLSVPAAPVASVAGRTGAITLTAADISGIAAAAPVQSVAGLTGAVTNLSAAQAQATGSSTARSLGVRFGDVYNVLDYGADPTGTTDFAAAFQTLASSLASTGGTLYFPRGTYRLNSPTYLPDKALIEVDGGVTFLGGGHFNTDADTSVLSNQQAAKTFMRLGGTDSNSWTMYASQLIGTTTGATSYEKAAIYAISGTYDQSSYSYGTSYDASICNKDAVGIQASGQAYPGNVHGRVWGVVAEAAISPGAEGNAVGLEVDLVNNGASQPENNRETSKVGISIVNLGPNQGTNACLVNSGGGTWYDGYTVVKSSVSRNAFVLRDLSVYPSVTPAYIDASGNAGFQALSAAGTASFAAGVADASYSLQSPTNGFAITIPAKVSTLQLAPAGVLASGSITMPANPVN